MADSDPILKIAGFQGKFTIGGLTFDVAHGDLKPLDPCQPLPANLDALKMLRATLATKLAEIDAELARRGGSDGKH